MKFHGPWTAPSAGIYAADGLMVCSLGDRQCTKAYRQRGDTAGSMMSDYATLIAAAPALLESLQAMLDLHIAHHNEPTHAAARKAITAATVRRLSPSERGETFTVPQC